MFLFPCNVNESFENVLCKSLGLPFDTLDSMNATKMSGQEFLQLSSKAPVIKLNLDSSLLSDALTDLYSMNIDSASLFPGIDGFARSLNSVLSYTGYGITKFRFAWRGSDETPRAP